ncbi:cysteine synthase A [Helicobacter winghamensis]|uniref:Cysteine synthase n=1 Tax=Helicobacter winghamensis TaxID=157268 RepID=A0A2N3PKG6_9HELI|nr:cysteine synthase A [Helicobacter winghamensis]EEO25971.1 cysteine synthase A [Helicobacter winghamensis ATCC BAA-430]PKT76982.1 cysteine synthase A [Helicobacter winghamensis]PKT77122.1 cysteine synthase A [Helicobacter winghamensis]PKT77683.1 cysteine synthase A [Helicobacter winghamensis]PKT81921.1 cysteine synthase A [Helicobacter winghamensis]
MKIIHSITETIGNTPLLKLEKLSKECGANIFAKCEFLNPTSSIKDRIALGMIEDALQSKRITKDTILIEPTSGNTGIGLASVCAAKGIKLILTMPESMSIERRRLMSALGAELVLTSKEKGMKGAVEKAAEIQASTPNSMILQQFQNPSNPKAHKETTAIEILDALENQVDIFISAVGTGGTLSGVGSVLKQRNLNTKIIAIEPINSAVLSGEAPGPHKIQGIGAGFIPDTLDRSLIDDILKVDVEWAYKEAREIAKNEGILIGISSGANLWAAREIAKSNPGKNIVTILCDTGERYLSTELYEE